MKGVGASDKGGCVGDVMELAVGARRVQSGRM